jgi:hypothetical protein
MPSKNYNGNNPLGRSRIKPNGLDPSGAFAKVETAIGRLQPSLSLQTGSMQLPNGRVQKPKRARRVGGGATTTYWKLSTFKDGEVWKYRVGFGLLNNIISDSFDVDTRTFTGLLPSEDEIQIGLKVQLNAPVNIAGYVMPGFDDSIITGGVTYGSLLTFVAEAFDDFRFAALNLPNGTTPTGFAVIPIGKIIKIAGETPADDSYAVDLQILRKNVSGIYSPVTGYVVY